MSRRFKNPVVSSMLLISYGVGAFILYKMAIVDMSFGFQLFYSVLVVLFAFVAGMMFPR